MPTREADCAFCAIVAGDDPEAREIYRDDDTVAVFPDQPATLGHTLVIPREHLENIWALDEEIASKLAVVTLSLAKVMRDALALEGLNVIQSNGEVATQTIRHVHIHLVPRWTGDALGRIWPPETHYTESQKDDAWETLRSAVQARMRP